MSQTHKVEDLNYFMMRRVDFKEVNLDAAVERVHADYVSLCKKTVEEPLAIKFKFLGQGDERLSFSLEGSYVGMLQQLALVYGVKLESNGLNYSFSGVDLDQKVVTKKYQVAPDFAINMAWMKSALKERAEIDFLPKRSQLLVKACERWQFLVRQYVDYLNSQKKIQIIHRIKLVVVPQKGLRKADEDALMKGFTSEAETTRLLRVVLPSYKGAEVYSFPSVAVRPGEEGMVEIDRGFGEGRWLGVKYNVLGNTIALKAECEIDFEYRHTPRMQLSDVYSGLNVQLREEDEVVITEVNAEHTLHSSEYRWVQFDFKEEYYTFLCVTQDLVDPAGNKLRIRN